MTSPMLRILLYLALVFAVAAGAAWIADRPGIVEIDWLGWRIGVPILTAFAALLAFVVAVMIAWRLLTMLVGSPRAFGRFLVRRKRERGHEALSRGLVAVGAGDAKLARRYASEARKALPGDPATKLLEAQSAQLNGDPAAARAIFRAMLDDPSTRVLGLHGLHVEAVRAGDTEAARRFAAEAAAAAPALPWAGNAVFADAAAAGDWEAALAILQKNAHNGLVDKAAAKRQRAVLLAARALELEDRDPDKARAVALEAHALAPDLVPAAAVAGRVLTRLGDTRRAAKVLEATWKRAPHPEIAEAYAHVRTGDAARDRLKRLRTLAALKPGEVEGRIAIARAAIDARAFDEARAELKAVIAARPTQRAFLMMADLDETEHGDMGRVREWLGRAVRAPRDPAWTADGVVAERWAPVSPVTGRLDAFEWKTPMEALGAATAGSVDEALFAPPKPIAGPASGPGTAGAAASGTGLAGDAAAGDAAAVSGLAGTRSAQGAQSGRGTPAASAAAGAGGVAAAAPAAVTLAPASASGPVPAAAAAPPTEGASGDGPAPPPTGAARPGATDAAVRPVEFPLPHLPDDPGPTAAEDPADSRRAGTA